MLLLLLYLLPTDAHSFHINSLLIQCYGHYYYIILPNGTYSSYISKQYY